MRLAPMRGAAQACWGPVPESGEGGDAEDGGRPDRAQPGSTSTASGPFRPDAIRARSG